MLQRVYRALMSYCEEAVIVRAEEEHQEQPGTEQMNYRVPAGSGVRWVRDLRPGREGPLAGMEAGFAAARYPRVFVAAGDMPFIPPALIAYLMESAAPAAIPYFSGKLHPLCAAYDRGLQALFSPALDRGVRAVQAVLDEVQGVEYVREDKLREFGDPEVFLMNVNSPEDLERARTEGGGGRDREGPGSGS